MAPSRLLLTAAMRRHLRAAATRELPCDNLLMYRQVELRSGDDRVTCWLEEEQGLKEGARLSLKGDARIWTVERISSIRLEKAPRSDWKVGGLL